MTLAGGGGKGHI